MYHGGMGIGRRKVWTERIKKERPEDRSKGKDKL